MVDETTILNVEIKARHEDLDEARDRLVGANARVEGNDRQVDTYFPVADGRLKLREGFIERTLIHYRREDQAGPRGSEVELMRLSSDEACRQLRNVLQAALGVSITVRKNREIYYIDNVKVHLDTVDGLGKFVEVEAASAQKNANYKHLDAQCREVMQLLQVDTDRLIGCSYSDLLLEQQ